MYDFSFIFPAFLNLGPWEIALILFLALLLFGGKKLPGLAKDLGQGIREFRRSISGSPEDDHPVTQDAKPPVENKPAELEEDDEEEYVASRTRSVKKTSKAKVSAKKKAKKKA